MKRAFICILIMGLLFSGCSLLEPRMMDPVTFYYLEKDYLYGEQSSVLAAEMREASGHRSDISYLMALYLMGPTEEEHMTPLPAGTRIYASEEEGGGIRLELSEASGKLSDSEYSLACACLAMTCFDISEAEKITVVSGERSITMNRNSLTLFDDRGEISTTEETQ